MFVLTLTFHTTKGDRERTGSAKHKQKYLGYLEMDQIVLIIRESLSKYITADIFLAFFREQDEKKCSSLAAHHSHYSQDSSKLLWTQLTINAANCIQTKCQNFLHRVTNTSGVTQMHIMHSPLKENYINLKKVNCTNFIIDTSS